MRDRIEVMAAGRLVAGVGLKRINFNRRTGLR
jgi:hypothetical protein